MALEHSIVIDAPAEVLFDLSQDYKRRLEWDPFLRSAELLDGSSEPAVGVRALCVDRNGTAMETEYVTYNRPRAVAIKMTRGPWFLESFAGSWRFEEIEPGRTRVDFSYSVKGRPRWLASLLDPILRRVFAREMRPRMEGLKAAAEGSQAQVGLPVQSGRLVAPPKQRRRSTLDELSAKCDPNAPRDIEDDQWLSDRSAGGEQI
jgi:ribosome-associated toxin RatA of RatAB toxin-antitoxin module/antitoxin component of MazEF toxin-antitoxin module